MNDYEKTLSTLQTELAQQLLDRIKSGEASSGDFQAARQLLKDNQMFAMRGTNKPLEALAEENLPSFDDLKLEC